MFNRILSFFTGRPPAVVYPGDRGLPRATTFRQIREAERFLDRLENHKVGGLGFAVASQSQFVVRWRT